MSETKLSPAMEFLMRQPYIGGEDVTAPSERAPSEPPAPQGSLRCDGMVGGASPAAEIKPYEQFFTLQYTIWCGGTDICHTDNSTRAELCQLAITQFMRSSSGRAWMKRQPQPNTQTQTGGATPPPKGIQ